MKDLRLLIREYVLLGGRDAFSFSMLVSPRFGDAPGREIQRLIDEEAAKIAKGDGKMEQYLIEQYEVIEDKRWLKDVNDIDDYFGDIARDYMECGQGYYEDEAHFICKIGDKFYEVNIYAEIGSAKQDVGDRLYWIDGIEKITYREIDKPTPKPVTSVSYIVTVTSAQKAEIDGYLETKNITFEKGTR